MILEKKNTLKPLIESSGGVHLTAYLTNAGDLSHLKAQIQAVITKAEVEIEPAMSAIDRRLFLAPLRLLLTSGKLLGRIKHNIGIFRTSKVFRLLALPIEVDDGCVVATSFHVKPLLRWMRVDREFLLLGLEKNAAHLYTGSQHSIRHVETLEFPEGFEKTLPKGRFANGMKRSVVRPEAIDSLCDWLRKFTSLAKPKLFVAGEVRVAQTMRKVFSYPKFNKHPLSESFDSSQLPAHCFEIRVQLESEAMSDLEKIVTEFHCAEGQRNARRNLFQIAKAVAQGRVRKLLVADGVKIFGRFNSKTGALTIHSYDRDHEDDDILDDLAQSVLSKGGEVVVTSKEDTPDGHLAWAILDHSTSDLSRSLGLELQSRLPNQRLVV
jgi:hypothetical protein